MTRVCSECGAEVGSPHHRKLNFVWKKQSRNLIEQRKKQMQEAVKVQLMKGGK